MQAEQKYWFPAKRYGWGWGFPTAWQGIVVMLLYVGLLAAGMLWLVPEHAHGLFVLYAGGLTTTLLIVCWLKGEPPRWRWGDHD